MQYHGTVISFFDKTGAMMHPWAMAGFTVYLVDLQHPKGLHKWNSRVQGKHSPHDYMGNTWTYGGDVKEFARIYSDIVHRARFLTFFPPCTDLAVSGARWFKEKAKKDPQFQEKAMDLVYWSNMVGEVVGCPYMIENPVSVISTKWRKPDHTFQPHDFVDLEPTDNYTKKTCLWTGGGFVMPEKQDSTLGEIDDRIHKAAPSPERANFRSATPRGFARAVFNANIQVV